MPQERTIMGNEGKVQAQVDQMDRSEWWQRIRYADSLILSCRGEPWLKQNYQSARESEESHKRGVVTWVKDGGDHTWGKTPSKGLQEGDSLGSLVVISAPG